MLQAESQKLLFENIWTMSDMVKYRVVSFKKDQIAALYFTMSDIVHIQTMTLIQRHWIRILKENMFIIDIDRPLFL